MNKEEFLKIQTCVLKVNIHCDGCKQKVKKILQKIDGVYTIKIDSDQGKVTVSGNIDAATLVKKLTKNGKHAEIWGASKANNSHQNQLNNQLKNLHMDNGKGGNNKGQVQKNGGNNPPKGGPQGLNPQIQQQLQQLQQLKGYQDLKIPPQLMKDMRIPIINKDQNQKSVKFSVPEEEDMTDEDDYDDDDDDDDYEDDDYDDDEMDDMPMHNKKPVMGNGHGGAQMPNIMMNNIMKGVGNGGNNGGNGAGNLNKGGSGGGNVPVQMNLGGASGGKKGGDGNNNGGNQNQGGGKGGKNGGGQPQDGKNVGGHNKNGNGGGGAGNGINFNANGGKNGVGMKDMHHGMMPNMMNVGQMGMNMPMPMGHQMGNLPMGQMGHLSAVQGLPASAANGGGGGGGAGYFPGGANPEQMAGNPYYQQHLATMMMNQQRANGNERFHPMMYARPPPAVNYMPPYPPYPYPPPPGDRLDHYSMFSDENTSSCTVM